MVHNLMVYLQERRIKPKVTGYKITRYGTKLKCRRVRAGRVRDNTTDVMRKQLQLLELWRKEQARSYELQGRELQGEKLREAVLQKNMINYLDRQQ